MKKYILSALAGLLALSVNAQFQPDKEPFLTKSLTSETINSIRAETSGGSITVEGGTGNSRIEVFVRPNNFRSSDVISKDELQKRLDENYDLEVSVSNNKLTAIAKQKHRNMNWKEAVSISYKIYVQQNVSTDLATSGGSINLKNITGTQDFATSGGSLNLEKLSGKIVGRTSGGSINVSNSTEDIDLSTSGGSIQAKNCTGRLRLSTSGGSLNLSDLKGDIKATTSGGSVNGHDINGQLSAHTSGGNVSLENLTCSLDASTSGGNISVEMSELNGYVKLSNSAGNINLTIPNKGVDLRLSADRIKTDKLNNFSGKMEEDNINGKLNGGGIPITVNAGSGRITLELK